MLTAITLEGFRSFAEATRVTFGGLTLLAGANNAGKSSAIHALLVLIQSEQQPSEVHLRLSGEWVDVGSFNQALNYSRGGENRRFRIGLTCEAETLETDFVLTLGEPQGSGEGFAKIERVEALVDDGEILFEPSASEFQVMRRATDSTPWENLGTTYRYPWTWISREGQRIFPFGPTSILYVSAFRDMPRTLYHQRRSKLGPLLGSMGEYVAETLFERRNDVTDVLPSVGPPQLIGTALEAWWAHIFDGDYGLRAESADELGFTISLDTPSAENLRLTQVGTGLSQVLPIIVLGLCSKPNDIVIVESPEAQLHPAAQHRLMDLLIALVHAGRQVIVETHSDHIVHAAQLAVKSGKIPFEKIAMRFFSQKEGETRVDAVPVDAQGRLTRQPIGFMDQASADLLELIK